MLPSGFDAVVTHFMEINAEVVAMILEGASSYHVQEVTAAVASTDHTALVPLVFEYDEEDVARILLGLASYHVEEVAAAVAATSV
jgi:hypothetical protein